MATRRRSPRRRAAEQLAREWGDRELAHAVLLTRFARGMTIRVGSVMERELLEDVAAEVARRTRSADRGMRALATRRVRVLLDTVQQIVQRGSDAALARLKREVADLSRVEAGWVQMLGRDVLGVDWSTPAPKLVEAAVARTPMMGRLWGEYYEAEIPRRTEAAVVARVRAGIVAGESTPQIVRGLQGLPQARYADGTLAATRRALDRMARTITTHVANVARDLSFRENADVVPEVRWIATLDLRLCPVCAALDGQKWPANVPHPQPPAHENCRCSLIPAIGERIGKRASMDGPVDAKLDAADWLRRQPPERQEAILGKRVADAFRSGKLDVAKVVDAAGRRRLTIQELEALGRL